MSETSSSDRVSWPKATLLLLTAVCVAAVGAAVEVAVSTMFSTPTEQEQDDLTSEQKGNLLRRDEYCRKVECDTATAATGIVACLDTSGSVPAWFVEEGRAMVARHVEQLVGGPTEGTVVFVRVLHAQSYSPTSGVFREEIPAVPVVPVLEELSSNPFEEADNVTARRAHADDVGRWLALLNEAKGRARAVADKIRVAELPRTERNTDVRGCLLRAQHLLASVRNRQLIIVSDLKPYGPQSQGRLDLRGVDITVAYWCKDASEVCAKREREFKRDVTHGGAPSPQFVDPQDLRSFA